GFEFWPAGSEAFQGLPVNTLGTDYYALTYDSQNGNGGQFTIVATHDDTVLTITPSKTLYNQYPAGDAYFIELAKGQTYTLGGSQTPSVSGTHTTSTSPIAVFGPDPLAYTPADKLAGNLLVEQLPPVDAWGSRYLTAPLAGRSFGDF